MNATFLHYDNVERDILNGLLTYTAYSGTYLVEDRICLLAYDFSLLPNNRGYIRFSGSAKQALDYSTPWVATPVLSIASEPWVRAQEQDTITILFSLPKRPEKTFLQAPKQHPKLRTQIAQWCKERDAMNQGQQEALEHLLFT